MLRKVAIRAVTFTLLVLFGMTPMRAQIVRAERSELPTLRYKVIFTDYVNVDFTDRDGFKKRIIGVCIASRSLGRAILGGIASDLRTKYSGDDSIIVIFGIEEPVIQDLLSGSDDDSEERSKMKSIRGLYYFDKPSSRNELRYYPKGMTEKDFKN